MAKKQFETLVYSAGGVIALAAILVAVNFLTGAFNPRIDLTEGDVYTLSPGTKEILSRLEAPVTIRYYYTQGGNAVPVGLKTFAKRVEDLLAEYRAASGGKVVIEKFNPEPDSDAEDSAALDNVEGQMTNTGEKFYLGLSVSFLDQKAAIPVLAPDRERLLDQAIEEEVGAERYARIVRDGDWSRNLRADKEDPFWFDRPLYIKPHGTVSEPQSLRFTRDAYFALPADMTHLLRVLLEGAPARVFLDRDRAHDAFGGTASSKSAPTRRVCLLVLGHALQSFELRPERRHRSIEHGKRVGKFGIITRRWPAVALVVPLPRDVPPFLD